MTVTVREKPSTRSMSCSTISTGMLAATFLTRFETRSRSAAARPASGSARGRACGCGGARPAERPAEQQPLRFGAERDAEIAQPLAAVGQFAALDGLDALEAEEFYQFGGLGMDRRIDR